MKDKATYTTIVELPDTLTIPWPCQPPEYNRDGTQKTERMVCWDTRLIADNDFLGWWRRECGHGYIRKDDACMTRFYKRVMRVSDKALKCSE